MQENPQLPEWLVAERGETMQLIDEILKKPGLPQCIVQAEAPYINEEVRYEYRIGDRLYTIVVFAESGYSRQRPDWAPRYMFNAKLVNGHGGTPSAGDVNTNVYFSGDRNFSFYYPGGQSGQRSLSIYKDHRQDDLCSDWQREVMGKTGHQALMEILGQFMEDPGSLMARCKTIGARIRRCVLTLVSENNRV